MKKSAPILAAGMDLDPGDGAARERERAGSHRDTRLVDRVRDAVGQQRLDAGPAGEDLDRADPARGGIAIARGGYVRGDLVRDAPECAESQHRTNQSGTKNGSDR